MSALAVGLGVAWGVVSGAALLWGLDRRAPARRSRALRRPARPAPPGPRRAGRAARARAARRVAALPGLDVTRRVVLDALARRRRARDDAVLERELPVTVDLLGVAAASGCTPYLAVEHAVRWAPPRAAAALGEVVAATRLGAGLGDALRSMGAREPHLRPVCDVLEAGARLGTPVAPALGRVAAETRADLRRRAEARARALSVRLLFPLVFLVLPAFGLLTVVPALLNGFRALGD